MANEKPANQDLSQQITGIFVSSDLETLYEQYMDAMLNSIGRNITIYLPPSVTESTVNKAQYNPFTGQKDPRLGNAGEGPTGKSIVPTYVIYKAHVVHGPRAPTQDIPWDLNEEDVQLTLVIGALDDVKKAVEVDVDGIKYVQKSKDIRQVGLTTPKYLITLWSRKVKD